MNFWAIGDVHGCYKQLENLINKIIKIEKNDIVYLLGDMIDRGPDSKKVLDFIMDLCEKGYNIKCLRGNHEDLFLRSLIDEETNTFWVDKCGGKETLESFNVNHISEVPEIYVKFIKATSFYDVNDYAVLVHAGINLLLEDPLENSNDLMWSRNLFGEYRKNPGQEHPLQESLPFLLEKYLGSKLLVHGHTPLKINAIISQEGPVFNIDGGCCYANYGMLVALNLRTKELIY